ncbi:membrane protein insertase YidC [Pontixanthobacter aestiaquae]|uniref:Membrane protein insertase YidC n=1 Tax=Pontixanthobacter aestiaquae TaxID=1509367 RepID=A0A844Z3F5_9SPHN|nr:membrane protein insertase YidC [Pontixanthobacter aestiaquae]MDN3646547.1 membrane protein insertase YidC [Pontixanthobacter aestiaquae]MXO82465.1 membrane protein insertase YidC [Pontixanthobacter aestiaquae]
MDNQRNLLLAVVLCGLMLVGWEAGMSYFYPDRNVTPTEEVVATAPDGTAVSAPATTVAGSTDLGDSAAPVAAQPVDLDSALNAGERITIDSPEVLGTINTVGARLDDITLKTHRQTVDKDSDNVRIFSPKGTDEQHYARFGWLGEGVNVPQADTLWQASGGTLTQDNPVTLRHDNGEGQLFTIEFAIDEHYMITAKQTVANTGAGPIVVRPYGLIDRTSSSASDDLFNVHSGPIGNFGDAVQFGPDYDDLAEDSNEGKTEGRVHWIGFTDVYWLSALIPAEGSDTDATFRSQGNDIFRADMFYQPFTVAPGTQVARTTQLFAGAKETAVLDAYEDAGVDKFGKSVDWGWFEIIAWPIWWLLTHLFALVGNFGLAIIGLTVLIRLVLFPIAQKQFASMAAMKAIQPKMKAIQERYKDDKQKQQQEIMALYKKEKVNPLAGCLPILIQIPIFFALYKVLILAIEMRHQPFVLWLKDLSAPDPATILNLFGYLPFEVPSLLAIGPLAILLGVTMWLTFKMNPTAMDPIQQQIFNIMPWMLMFVMAPFAAGLLLYWVTNNVLTLAQQTYLYSKHPQLRAAAEKEKADKAAAAAREVKE